jgi:anti-sigma regulatory factor (Ser/Thr protein kinase)
VWHNQAILNEAEFALDGNFRELEPLTAQLAQFCRANDLGGDVEFELNLVLEELFTNAVRHGGCEGMKPAAQIRLQSDPDGVSVEFADRGIAFDPLGAALPDLTVELANRKAGGLGIHLVRQIMQDLQYRRAGEWNRLTMRRALRQKAEEGGQHD